MVFKHVKKLAFFLHSIQESMYRYSKSCLSVCSSSVWRVCWVHQWSCLFRAAIFAIVTLFPMLWKSSVISRETPIGSFSFIFLFFWRIFGNINWPVTTLTLLLFFSHILRKTEGNCHIFNSFFLLWLTIFSLDLKNLFFRFKKPEF